jgi:hypothetical protein
VWRVVARTVHSPHASFTCRTTRFRWC